MHNLAGLRQKRGQIVDRMKARLDGAINETRALTAEEQTADEADNTELKALDDTIARIERNQAEVARSAQPVNQAETTAAGAERNAKQRKPGDAVSRIVRSLAATKGDPRRAAEYCEQTIRDAEVAKALAASSAAAGGFLVPEQYSAELIEFLRPASVVRRMNARVVPMPAGNLSMPKQTGGATASYIGENSNVPKTEPTFGQLKLSAKKLAALVPISNDLIRFSSPQADEIVRVDLVNSIAQAEDSNFMRSDGSAGAPKGLKYWTPAANVIAVNATVNLANIEQDLGKLELALLNANVRMISPGWLMAPRTKVYLENLRDGNGNKAYPEMANGMLKGFPFAMTTQIPINLAVTGTAESEVYFVDFADAIIGEVPGFVIETSSEAAYYDGSAVVSAFSLDQTVIKVIAQHDFGMRHDASVAYLKDVDWA
jgi:HK97 family phage major capsid protein